MTALQSIPVDVIISRATKYAEENPIVVGASAAFTSILAAVLIYRRREMKRDGNDYESQLTGGFKILNNSDHTLKVFIISPYFCVKFTE